MQLHCPFWSHFGVMHYNPICKISGKNLTTVYNTKKTCELDFHNEYNRI